MQAKSNKILIIDVGNPDVDGKLSDWKFLNSISHTLLPLYELVRECTAIGIDCITPDVFLSNPSSFENKRVLLVSHLTNQRTSEMIRTGAEPFLLFCQESPMVATRFYANFRKISRQFTFTMAFSDMQKRAHVSTTFISLHFPIYSKTVTVPNVPFGDKKLLVLIAGNKNAPVWKAILIKFFFGYGVRLIYPVRKKLVESLAAKRVIDLYGKGWNTDKNKTVRTAYQGLVPPDGKLNTLSQYKFTLCFENAIFPGYITEKLFDALLADSVPIYLGDPNILESVPSNTFIDAREFKDIDNLYLYLDTMSEETYEKYRKAGKEFLDSTAFEKFNHITFVKKVLNLVNSYGRN